MTFESTRSQIKPIDRSSGRLLYQPHSAVDEDHHANNGHARNSGKEQWIKHWTLHRHVFGLATPGGHAKSENRLVALEWQSAGQSGSGFTHRQSTHKRPNVVDEFGSGSADPIPRRDSGFAPVIKGRFVDTERLGLHPGKRDPQRSGESAESRQP